MSNAGKPPQELFTVEQMIGFNKDVEMWRPNINYPFGTVVRYNPHSRYSQSQNYDTQYAKKLFGYFNLPYLFSSKDEDAQLSYYKATGKFGNLCAPDDDWITLIHYAFRQPATVLFGLQCGCLLVMFLFTVYACLEKKYLVYNLIHLFMNTYIQHRWVFRFWQIKSE